MNQYLIDIAPHFKFAGCGTHHDERKKALRVGIVGALRRDIASRRRPDRQDDAVTRRPDRIFLQKRFGGRRGLDLRGILALEDVQVRLRYFHGIPRGVQHIAAHRLRIQCERTLLLGQRIGGAFQVGLRIFDLCGRHIALRLLLLRVFALD